MNKFGVVLGIAAVATLAGCKDPDFNRSGGTVQNEVKDVETAPAKTPAEVAPPPVVVEPVVKKCTCPPGTKHTSPCTCGAPDCKCVVETKPVVTADLTKPVEPEYTVYVVQNGDYLAKISKKFNVTISSIKRLNPSIKKDVILVGQKLKLPGKIDIGAQAAPVAVAAAATTAAATTSAAKKPNKKGFASYTGATKEYVVKNGDTLGSIAYGNGINIRQLKELNGLSSDSLKIGQKLKIPAAKVSKAAPAKAAAPVAKKEVAKKEKAEAAAPAKAAEPAKAEAAAPVEAVEKPDEATAAEAPAEVAQDAAAPAPVAEAAKDAAPAKADAAATTTYVVQEGDDMTGVSIRWGVSSAEIRELNNLAETDQLVPGQIIKLPADAQQ